MKKHIYLALLLYSFSIFAAPPAEEADLVDSVPAWVNAGEEKFRDAERLMKASQDKDHSQELLESATAMITGFAEANPGHKENILGAQEKIDILGEWQKFDLRAYSALHFYLAALVSPESVVSPTFQKLQERFCNAWDVLIPPTSEFPSINEIQRKNSALGFKNTLDGIWLDMSSVYDCGDVKCFNRILPMHAFTQEQGNLGVKPLLQWSLKGYMPIILTPPGEGSVHGGIISSPFDMIMHDLIHGILINKLSEEAELDESFVLFVESIKGQSVEEQRALMAAFVLIHEFPANDAFSIPSDFEQDIKKEEESSVEIGSTDLQQFIASNIGKIETLYQTSDADLEQAAECRMRRDFMHEIGDKYKKFSLDDLRKHFSTENAGLVILKSDGSVEYEEGVKEEAFLFESCSSDVGSKYLCVDFRKFESQIFKNFTLFDHHDNGETSLHTYENGYIKIAFALKNFLDYGKILQLVNLLPQDRDFDEEPLKGEEVTKGLERLIRALPAF